MKTLRSAGFALLLALPLTVGTPVWAQTDKPAKTPKAAKTKTKTPTLSKNTLERLERIAGKPLTDAQKAAALQAENSYKAAMKALADKRDADFATALGLTVEQMEAAEKAARQKAMDEKKAEKEEKPAAE